MPGKVLRRCAICKRYGASFLAPDDGTGVGGYLCARCWKARNPVPDWDYGGLAAGALEHYDLSVTACRLIRHNENMAFHVLSAEGEYLLRIHKPITPNFEGARLSVECLESELAWLSALGRETTLVVQKPMRNRDGERVSFVECRGETVPCTLLGWIEGMDFDQGAPDAPAHARELGALVAGLHDFVERWERPAGFARPAYDAEHFRTVVKRLSAGVDLGFISRADFDLLERACEEIFATLAKAQSTPGEWGLIHADLGPHNVIVRKDGLSPIDFCLCGDGPFMWDVGGMLPSFKRELRRDWLAGYEEARPLKPGWERFGDGLALMSIASCQAFHISNPAKHEWLAKRLPRSVESEWRRFLDGKGLMFDV